MATGQGPDRLNPSPPPEPPHGLKEKTPLYEFLPDGNLRFNFHEGQWRAWNSPARFVVVLAGARSGKTSFAPWWLAREIERKGPGDYLAVTSTYDLFRNAFLPAMREVFVDATGMARYWPSSRVFELRDPDTGEFWASRQDDAMWGRILLRSAEKGGLEATTAKAAILDEAGQDVFTVEAWEAIQRRLSLDLGRCFIGSTIYNFNWIKYAVYDRWQDGDPNFEVIQFDTTANPNIDPAEFERAKATMPLWRFEMQYRGRFSKPAGLVYDSFLDDFDPLGHIVRPFNPPQHWRRYLGLDFGGINTAGTYWAEDPQTGLIYAYKTYHGGQKTAAEHVRDLIAGEPVGPDRQPALTCFGGSPSEGQWRQEFLAAGLPVYAPDVSAVDVGIARVYGAFKLGRLRVMSHLTDLLNELRAYSYKLDSAGNPTGDIENKSRWHTIDSVRYIIGWRFKALHTTPLGRTSLPNQRWGA